MKKIYKIEFKQDVLGTVSYTIYTAIGSTIVEALESFIQWCATQSTPLDGEIVKVQYLGEGIEG